MLELYTLTYGPAGLQFTPREDPKLRAALEEDTVAGYAVQTALGDDNLLDCLVMRKEEGAGGIFIVEDDMEALMAVVAETNLAYVEGLNHFAEMVAQARYAADIYENNGEEDEE